MFIPPVRILVVKSQRAVPLRFIVVGIIVFVFFFTFSFFSLFGFVLFFAVLIPERLTPFPPSVQQAHHGRQDPQATVLFVLSVLHGGFGSNWFR